MGGASSTGLLDCVRGTYRGSSRLVRPPVLTRLPLGMGLALSPPRGAPVFAAPFAFELTSEGSAQKPLSRLEENLFLVVFVDCRGVY